MGEGVNEDVERTGLRWGLGGEEAGQRGQRSPRAGLSINVLMDGCGGSLPGQYGSDSQIAQFCGGMLPWAANPR